MGINYSQSILQGLKEAVGLDFDNVNQIEPLGKVDSDEKDNHKPDDEVDEVEASQINLSSFKFKEKLNPYIFKENGEMDGEVRLKLLDIADQYIEFLALPWVDIVDIIVTGSIASYNWSKYSDVDLHIIVDYNQIDDNIDMVEDLLYLKKDKWNSEHGEIEIHGYEVELYVEDSNTPSNANGKYSIQTNEWIKKPSKTPPSEIQQELVKSEAAKIMTRIDDCIDEYIANKDNDAILSKLKDKVEKLRYRATHMRQSGIEREGDNAWENIVFKILRRSNYLDKIENLERTLYNKEYSLT